MNAENTQLDDQDFVVCVEDDDDFFEICSLSDLAEAYLTAQGILAETRAAFRLEQASPAALARLGLTGRRALGSGGVSLPTFDPRTPHVLAGVVRLNFAQNVHRFVTAPAGIAGPITLADAECVVLADNSLLAMKLYQEGVVNVALVEDLAVLAPLADWLRGRKLICVSYRGRDLARMQAALADLGITATGHVVSMSGKLSDDVRAKLGLAVGERGEVYLPITGKMVVALYSYAVGRMETAEAQAALATLGITDRAILDAYSFGFLPADFRSALPPEIRAAISGRQWASALVIPACDEQGVVVDLLIVQVTDGGHVSSTVWDAPRGLIAQTLTRAFPHLIVTDSIRRVGRLFRPNLPALLLRGVEDARANAARLAAGGVERVELRLHRDPETMAAVLEEVGIAVEGGAERVAAIVPFPQTVGGMPPEPTTAPPVDSTPAPEPMPEPVQATEAAPAAAQVSAPAPAPAADPVPAAAPVARIEGSLILVPVSQDAQREEAVYRYGQAEYTVRNIRPVGTVFDVTCRVVGQEHPHHQITDLDLADPRNRRRFAHGASHSTKMGQAGILVALLLLLDAVPALARQWKTVPTAKPITEPMSEAEQVAARTGTRDDRLLERLIAYLDSFGWVGEADLKELAILAAISCLSDDPLWLVLTAGTAGERFPALRCLAAIIPAGWLVQASRLTDNAQLNANPQAFQHKLMLLSDLTTVSQAEATALRIMHTRDQLIGSQVEHYSPTGGMRTKFTAAHGPLAFIAAAHGLIPAPLRPHLLDVPVDESAAQVARTLDARRRALANPTMTQAAEQGAAHWRRILSLLTPAAVIIPAESEVALPPIVARSRPFQDAAFGLIVASALLHQHQRLRSDGAVVATPEDIARGIRLATGLAASRASDLTAQARQLLASLWSAQRTTFTMEDLDTLLPQFSRRGCRTALDELTRLDFVDAGRGGRGRLRTYTLVASSTAYDKAGREVGQLAEVGRAPAPTSTREAINA
jgi:hypothetical protein